MAAFTDDEFLVALDDLHSPEIGIKKLVIKMKEAHPGREGINAKTVREILRVLRDPGGADLVADARTRLPKPVPVSKPSPPQEKVEEPEEGDDAELFMTTQKEPREATVPPTPVPQPVFDENDAPPAQDEDEAFSSDDDGFFDASPRGATSSDEENALMFDSSPHGATCSEEEDSERSTGDAAFTATPKHLTPTPLRAGVAEYDAPVAVANVYSAAPSGALQQPSLFPSPAEEAKAFLEAALSELLKEQPEDPYAVLAEKCRVQAFLKGIMPRTPEKQLQAQPQPEPQPPVNPEPEVISVQEAVRRMKKYEDVGTIGVKRLVMEIKAAFPELMRNGVKVGAKEVRAAVHELTAVGLDTPPEHARKRIITPPPVPPEIESEVQLLATDGENILAGSPRGGPRGFKGLYAPTGLAGEVVQVGPRGSAASGAVPESPAQPKARPAESPAAFSEDEIDSQTDRTPAHADEFATARKEFATEARSHLDSGAPERVQFMARSSDGEFLSGSPRGEVGARNLFAPTGLAGHVRQHSIDGDSGVAGARGDSHGLVFIEQFAKSERVEMQVRSCSVFNTNESPCSSMRCHKLSTSVVACARRASATSSAQRTRNAYRRFHPAPEANCNLRCVSSRMMGASF